MRKLFFLLVLASGMLVAQTPNATNTQTIGKFLKLSKVPLGLETDNVLVRGTDGIVKFVPRSAFGGGSLPTLQQVFDNSRPPFVESKSAFSLTYRESFGYSNLTLDSYVASLKNTTNLFGDYYGEFSIPNGKPMMTLRKDNNKTINLQLRDPLYFSADVYVPCPPELATGNTLALSVNGNYADANGNITIAPGGNQNLQSVLENGNEVYLPFFLSVGANKYGVLQDNWNRYSVGVEKDGASLNFGVGSTPQLNYRHKNVDNSLTENSFLFPHNGIDNKTIPISVNGKYADSSTGNIVVSPITTTFTTNDGKTVTVTNGVITNIQ